MKAEDARAGDVVELARGEWWEVLWRDGQQLGIRRGSHEATVPVEAARDCYQLRS